MQLEEGSILEGKVTGILKFGAFVDLGNGKSGMVHISEVASTFVNDINEFLKVGQTVKVKIVSIAADGKIALSIKKAEPPQPRRDVKDQKDSRRRPDAKQGEGRGFAQRDGASKDKDGDQPAFRKSQPAKKPVKKEFVDPSELAYAYEPRSSVTDAGFEDMLSKFKASSEDRMSDLKRTMDVKKRGTRRK